MGNELCSVSTPPAVKHIKQLGVYRGGGQTVDGVMGRRVEEGAYTASLGQGVATVSGKCPLA